MLIKLSKSDECTNTTVIVSSKETCFNMTVSSSSVELGADSCCYVSFYNDNSGNYYCVAANKEEDAEDLEEEYSSYECNKSFFIKYYSLFSLLLIVSFL